MTLHTPTPVYYLGTDISGDVEDHHFEEIADPFIHTTVTIEVGFWDAVKALLRKRRVSLQVAVHVSGNQDAYRHVMNVRPSYGHWADRDPDAPLTVGEDNS